MKKLSKVLSLLLAVMMMFSVISITAAAADTYQIKYHANGGSGSMSNSTHEFGVEKALTASKLSRNGYAFLGWATAKAATEPEFYDKQVVVDLAEEGQTLVTLYAVWRANTYYVEFDANGGEGTMPVQTFTYGTAQTLTANTFTKNGYTFKGWAKSSTTGTVAYTDGKSVKNLTQNDGATITLYAVWEKNPVFVNEIFIESQPTKTEYVTGETLDTAGLVVKANLSDNTVTTVTDYTVSAPDMTTVGEKVVTVTYEGKTATFTIVVSEPVYDYTFTLEAPASVKIGETASIAAKLEGFYPDGTTVIWGADNDNFTATGLENNVLTAVATKLGTTVVTATLVDAKGNEIATASATIAIVEEIVEPDEPETPDEPVNPDEPGDDVEEPSFFEKIINFFKGLIEKILAIFNK